MTDGVTSGQYPTPCSPSRAETMSQTTILEVLQSAEFHQQMATAPSTMHLNPVYRARQFTAIPDVGATVRQWAASLGNGVEPQSLIPQLLHRTVHPRVSVFSLLVDKLGQSFSLDNGLAVQGLVMHWLGGVRTSKRSRGGKQANVCGPLLALKRERQPWAVWWEARMVRLWTWPDTMTEELLLLCRAVIDAVTSGQPEAACEHSINDKVELTGLADICVPCSKAVLQRITADYKCASLSPLCDAH